VPNLDFLSDPLFLIVAVTAFVAAMVRGFSGFGSGLIFMPVAAACIGPKPAAGVLFVVDTLLILPLAARAVRIVEWRELLPLGAGAMLLVPAGAAVLLMADPIPLRWAISIVTLVSVGLLAAGLRYRGPTRVWLSGIVGGIAGFMSGSMQIPGPPVLIYWLGRDIVPATMRANAIVFFMFTTMISGIAFAYGGIFTADVLTKSAALIPVYALGIWIGSRMFGWASDMTYRRIAYATIIVAALISMPVFG
jgi:uncharacterized protein